MTASSHPFRDRVRAWLGTDALPRMETTMANWLTVLNGLVEQTTAASAAQATSFSNLQGALDRQAADIVELRRLLQDAIDSQGEVTPEMQALVNQIGQSLDDMKKAADSADNGFEPVEPEEPAEPGTPTEPTSPETPAEPGTVQPPVDTEPVTDVPADETARR